jgi:hypothetical protein
MTPMPRAPARPDNVRQQPRRITVDSAATQEARNGRIPTSTAIEGLAKRWMEHRWGWRRPCRARVCVSTRGRMAGFGKLRDVSMSGAFLQTALSLPMFTQVTIAVLLDDGSHCEEFAATVVRREAGGVGVEWSEPVAGPICHALGCGTNCGYAAGAAD